jgi:adenylate kinase
MALDCHPSFQRLNAEAGAEEDVRLNRIGVTGSPATGKKTLGRALAARMNVPYFSINELAREGGFLASVRGQEPTVDTEGLRRVISSLLPPKGFVLSGVFLVDVAPSALLDRVVVLRCSPLVLRKRYLDRGYSQRKVREDLTAEFLDSCLADAIAAYGDKVREIDTTGKEPAQVLALAESSFRKKALRGSGVDWLSLLRGPKDVERFMI